MRIDHVALWTPDLDGTVAFYTDLLGGAVEERFEIAETGFAEAFVRFGDGPRLEVMAMPSVPASRDDVRAQFEGYIHVAFAVANRAEVDAFAAAVAAAGHEVLEPPHETPDGYYETTVLDPSGNRVEVAVVPLPSGA